MSEDFYEVLGVSRDADEDAIKQAYRKKAAEYHPDVSDDPDAEEKFKQVKKAKEVLTDEDARSAYDRMGHEQFEQAEKRGFDAGADGQDPFGGMGGMGGGQGSPFDDIFEQFFGGGGGGRGGRGGPRPGRDLRASLTVDLEDAYFGTAQEMTVTRPEHCPDCDGHGHPSDAEARTCPACEGRGQQVRVQQTPLGRVQQTTTCPQCEGEGTVYSETCDACDGEGVVMEESTLTVEVPAGIRDGQTLRMEAEGAPGEPGARDGDLLVEISVDADERFERDGDDLYITEPVSFPQAVFGDDLEVETFEGSVSMELPKGTQSGETFRLRGKGMPRLQRRGNGDLFVRVQVVTPEQMNAEQREALEAFAEAGGEDIDVKEGFFEKIKNSL
jgi:molecular chaperone DnaJ